MTTMLYLSDLRFRKFTQLALTALLIFSPSTSHAYSVSIYSEAHLLTLYYLELNTGEGQQENILTFLLSELLPMHST